MKHGHRMALRAPAAGLVAAALTLAALAPAQAAGETHQLVVDGVVRTLVGDPETAGTALGDVLVADVTGTLLPVPAADLAGLADRQAVSVTLEAPLEMDAAAAVAAAGQPGGDAVVQVVGAAAAGPVPGPLPLDGDGPHTLTVLPVHWTTPAQTTANLTGWVDAVASFWQAQSGGALTMTATVAESVAIADPGTCDPAALYNQALAAHGRAPAPEGEHVAVVLPQNASCDWTVRATLGGSQIAVNGLVTTARLGHAVGHNLGLGHASTWACTDDGRTVPLADTCSEGVAADFPDVMSVNSQNGAGALGTAIAERLGWVEVVEPSPTEAVTVRLEARGDLAGARALRIPLPDGTEVFVEYRDRTGDGAAPYRFDGVQLFHRDPTAVVPSSHRLDMQAELPGDATFAMDEGQVYVVPGSGYAVSVVDDLWLDGAVVRVVPTAIDTVAPTAPVITEPAPGLMFSGTRRVTFTPGTDGGSPVTHTLAVDGVLTTHVLPTLAYGNVTLTPGVHTLTVVATDVAGNTTTSEPVTVDAGRLPHAPVITSAVAGDRTITVTWAPAAVATPEYPAISSWEVSIQGGPPVTVPVDQLTYEFTGLTNRQAYLVQVAARNTLGVSNMVGTTLTPMSESEWIDITSPAPGATSSSPVTIAWTTGADLPAALGYYGVAIDGVDLRYLPAAATGLGVVLPAGTSTVTVTAYLPDGRPISSDSVDVEVTSIRPVFTDVSPGHPFAQHIEWMFQAGITTGYTDGTYRPNGAINRDAMAAFLYRYAYAELDGYEPPAVPEFSDVPLDHPFYTEISWLAETGITRGYPDGTFRPSSPVNRDAMAAFLYRFDAADEYYLPPDWEYFDDVPLGHQFFTEISWMADAGISTGWPDYTYRPGLPIARDAMAAFLYRFDHPTPATVPATVPDAV